MSSGISFSFKHRVQLMSGFPFESKQSWKSHPKTVGGHVASGGGQQLAGPRSGTLCVPFAVSRALARLMISPWCQHTRMFLPS